MMKWVCILVGALVIASPAAPSQTAARHGCAPPPGFTNVVLPSGLPPALQEVMGDIALPGEPFDTSDVYVKGHKYGRYIFVWNGNMKWIVATEHGGIALHSEIFVYRLGKDGKTAKLVDKSTGYVNDICGAATKLTKK